MSNQTRVIKPAAEEVPQEMAELANAVAQLSPDAREKVDPALARVIDSTRRRRRILSLVQDALSQLRLDMKYLAFDLEATRRERDEYRRQLEDASDAYVTCHGRPSRAWTSTGETPVPPRQMARGTSGSSIVQG